MSSSVTLTHGSTPFISSRSFTGGNLSSSSTVTSSSPSRSAEEDQNNLTVIISGVVVAVIVVLIIILIVGMLIVFTMRKKKKGLQINSNAHSDQSNVVPVEGQPGLDVPLTNPVYGGNNYYYKNDNLLH